MKTSKRLLIPVLMVLALAGGVFTANAKTSSNKKTVTEKVISVGSSSLKIKSYTVDVNSGTKITDKNGSTIALDKIKKGDKVKVSGKVSNNKLNATKVKDESR